MNKVAPHLFKNSYFHWAVIATLLTQCSCASENRWLILLLASHFLFPPLSERQCHALENQTGSSKCPDLPCKWIDECQPASIWSRSFHKQFGPRGLKCWIINKVDAVAAKHSVTYKLLYRATEKSPALALSDVAKNEATPTSMSPLSIMPTTPLKVTPSSFRAPHLPSTLAITE